MSIVNTEWPEWHYIYCDASKHPSTGIVGIGVYHQQYKITQKIKLPPETSVYTGECYGILKSLEYILLAQLKKTIIFSDSKSTLQAIEKFPFKASSSNAYLIDCKKLLLNCTLKNLNVLFAWIPGHHNITGNEVADKLAKDSVNCGDVFPYKNLVNDLLLLPKVHLRISWEENWDTSSRIKGKHYKLIQQCIPDKPWFSKIHLSKFATLSLIRMRLGHNCSSSHQAKLGISVVINAVVTREILYLKNKNINFDLRFLLSKKMSTRNVRKLFGTSTLPPLEGNSDEEFEPLFVKKKGKKTSAFTFEGLEISSPSGSDDNDIQNIEDTIEEIEEVVQEKKKKKKKRQRKPKTNPVVPEGVELDEVDRSVLEVNAMLGTPPPASPLPATPVEKTLDPVKQLLSVQSRHLNYHNEIKKIFGSETLDEDGKAKKCRPHNVTKYRRDMIVTTPENYHFQKSGLSMSLFKKENGYSYFVYNHSREYQKMHSNFLDIMNPEDFVPLQEPRMNIHIEALLETADYMFRAEEYSVANSILEQVITYLQHAAHPYFNLTDQTVRLEYKYMENRPFFVVVLKYLYMLTNKACHRTALELAKLLLNLDPTDPLAVIYVIDVLALRAREHKWLVDVIDYWSKERDANYLFNIKYSYALAHFHLAKKSKSNDYTHVDRLLKDAIMDFPNVTSHILEAAKHDASASIQSHEIFQTNVKRPHYVLYAKLACGKWREPPVMEWFLRNINELIQQYENDASFKATLIERNIKTKRLFADCPNEIRRHMHIVRPMSNLLVEWDLPLILPTRAWDPIPPSDGVNRYGYGRDESDLAGREPNLYSALINLFSSIRPNFLVQEHRGRRLHQRDDGEGPAALPHVDQPEEARAAAVRPVVERPVPVADRPATDRPVTDVSTTDPAGPADDSSDDSIDAAEIEAMHHEPSSSSRR
ncbi:unnamed protein product [Chilo suppressalis]|uniref:RNase H type-1 domain-containing protein n=1 Tax=Chilo suppressalis TaxID=168631 RepID=A0ABN8B2A1_CHISP|nr:hypothetical protein evm_008614 [Chilo suppressalis]CAH0401922.1 unnamed protein product [Chilo suppressalis]